MLWKLHELEQQQGMYLLFWQQFSASHAIHGGLESHSLGNNVNTPENGPRSQLTQRQLKEASRPSNIHTFVF